MLNLAVPVCSASYQNLTKFWLALPRDAWGPAFVKLEYDLDVDNLDFFHLDFLHLETLVHQLSNSLFFLGIKEAANFLYLVSFYGFDKLSMTMTSKYIDCRNLVILSGPN